MAGALNPYLIQENPAARYITTRPLNPEPASEGTIELVRSWLQNCQEKHAKCRKARNWLLSRWTPTRLINVGFPGAHKIRLHEISEKGMKSYAALSYCWGGDQQAITTTKATLQERLSNI